MTKRTLGFILATISLAACGDDDSTSSYRGVQDLRQVSYQLKNLEAKAKIEFPKGTQNLQNKVDFKPGESKDSIQRLIEDGNYVLRVNGQKVNLPILSNGKVERSETLEKNMSGCKLTGMSDIRGAMADVEFKLEWNLVAKIEGNNCDNSARETFVNFLNTEVNNLNLSTVRDLLVSADQNLSEAKAIEIQVKVKGEGV